MQSTYAARVAAVGVVGLGVMLLTRGSTDAKADTATRDAKRGARESGIMEAIGSRVDDTLHYFKRDSNAELNRQYREKYER